MQLKIITAWPSSLPLMCVIFSAFWLCSAIGFCRFTDQRSYFAVSLNITAYPVWLSMNKKNIEKFLRLYLHLSTPAVFHLKRSINNVTHKCMFNAYFLTFGSFKHFWCNLEKCRGFFHCIMWRLEKRIIHYSKKVWPFWLWQLGLKFHVTDDPPPPPPHTHTHTHQNSQ